MLRYFLASALCALIWVGLPHRASAADDAAALLAKHKAYVGWSFGDGTFKSMKMSGTAGPTYEFTRYQRGAQFHQTFRRVNSELQYDKGFTGSLFWSANQNGFTVPLIGEVAKTEVDLNYLFNEGFATLAGVARGNANVGEISTSIVRVVPQGGYPADLYIETASGALKRIVIDPDVQEIRLDILRYDMVDAMHRVMSSWRYEGANAVEVKSIEPNAAISEEQLHPPAQRAHWTFGKADPIALDVANGWDIGKGGIQFDATLNGVRGHFILDTGAGGIFLTSDFATRIHAKELAPSTTYGVNDLPIFGTISKVDTLQVGTHILRDVIVSTGPPFSNIDGLIGFDFLAGAIVDVDLNTKQMRLSDPATSQADTTRGYMVVADLSSGHIKVPVKVNGSADAIVALDSGDPALVLLSERLYTSHKVDMHLEGHSYLSGVGGTSRNYVASCGHLRDLTLGPIKYEYVPVCFQPANNPLSMGLVGFDFMKHFNWTFDYPHSRVILTKNGI